jgi:hypothetical protein
VRIGFGRIVDPLRPRALKAVRFGGQPEKITSPDGGLSVRVFEIASRQHGQPARMSFFGQRPAFFGQPFMWICALDNIGGA